jgi:hypothetical protein
MTLMEVLAFILVALVTAAITGLIIYFLLKDS